MDSIRAPSAHRCRNLHTLLGTLTYTAPSIRTVQQNIKLCNSEYCVRVVVVVIKQYSQNKFSHPEHHSLV